MDFLGLHVDGPTLLLGVVAGIPYGLLAVGLVLIYKVSKFVNFAQGAFGAFGGAIVATLVASYGVPYWAAFVIGIAIVAGVAAATEATIVRRLDGQPRLMGVVITLLIGAFLLSLAQSINAKAQFTTQFPKPAGFPTFTVGSLVVVQSYTAVLILSPFVIVALAWLLRRTRFGLAIRATAANPDAAWTVGIAPTKVAGRTWAIAGAIAGFSAILLGPTTLGVLGPGLLLRGLVAAAIARFESITVAFGAGIGIGVLDIVIHTHNATSGLADILLAVIALVVLLARPPRMGRESADDGNWTRLAIPPINVAYRGMWPARNFALVVGVVFLLGAVFVLPRFTSSQSAFTLSTTMAIAIVGLSVLVLTGRAGQLSLGQFAVAGIAAVVSVKVVSATGVFALGLLAAAAVGAIVTLVLGLPALRTRGLVFAITTLAFAIGTATWILPQPWMMGDAGLQPAKPAIGSLTLVDPKQYYFFALGMLAVAVALTAWVVRSRIGRDLVALRDNENAARALGVPVVARKVQAFLIAGALAGVGGAVLAHGRDLITPVDFGANTSIDVVVFAVVGGLGLVAGPVVGTFLGSGIPNLVALNTTAISVLDLLFLLLVLFRPGGVVSICTPIRDWFVEEYARLRGFDPSTVEVSREAPRRSPFRNSWGDLASAPRAERSGTGPLLSVVGVGKSYGGIRAVTDVSIEVTEGESVAVIGPNGAGKTTLFEIIAGFVRADTGEVVLDGNRLTRRSPERRAHDGLVRSFQNALLFPTMTVAQSVRLAAGGKRRRGRGPTPDQVLEAMGLLEFADETISTLPTGVRRLTELACDIVMAPRVLLLDEPSAGIAHSEIPQLGALLRRMRDEWGLTLVVIDHDMNLLRGVCDRFVAMELGEVIATGTADEVQSDPRVAESFLGGSNVAVERSAAQSPAPVA